ncbi:MAG: hypothetical protein ACOYNS_04405 [Bacteroidota bacterium]
MIKLCAGVLLGIISISLGQEISLLPKSVTPLNVTIEEIVYRSRKALHVTEIDESGESMAIVKDHQFLNGTIEAEIAGMPLPSANATARGFIGIAFRVNRTDSLRYDCFYIRPTNGRAEDQVRRNHSTQYIAHPSFTWQMLRKEYPLKYESYADIVEGEWTKVKITVKGKQAKLYLHDLPQPVLIVNELLN